MSTQLKCAHCHLQDSQNVNAAFVWEGIAVCTKHLEDRYGALKAAQLKAQAEQRKQQLVNGIVPIKPRPV